MKHYWTLTIILFTGIFLTVPNHLFAQATPVRPGLGIVDISDEETRLNYNQLFKLVLKDNPATLNKLPISVDLVEHQSQSAVAVKAIFLENSLSLVFYKDGQPCFKDTILLPKLERFRDVRCTNLRMEASQKGIVVVNLAENGPEYQQGIRSGDIIQEISGTRVGARDIKTARKLMEGTAKAVLVKIQRPATGEVKTYRVPLYDSKKTEWTRPLQTYQLQILFTAVLQAMAQPQSKTGISFKNGSSFKMKAVSKAKNLASSGKCKSYEQIALSDDSRMHALSPSVNLDSIFTQEKFFRPKESKKTEPGDASLNVLRYYNFDQNESFLGVNKNVSTEVKEVIAKMSGPFYDKPGVFANYFIGAKQYEKAGNYSAALNQYYGAYLKIDDMIASELVKANAKRIVFGRLAYCSKQLRQPEYTDLMLLAHDCLKITATDSELKKQNKEFYEFSKSTLDLSIDVENSLSKQRAEKRNAIIGAVLNAGMGLASFNLDSYISAGFFVNAVNIIDENQTLNSQINSMLYETTESVEFNLPPELQDDQDSSPFELIATASINYALERTANKSAVLDRIEKYATNRPGMKHAMDTTRQTYNLNQSRLDATALVAQLIRTEKSSFRYEKRGLPLPEAISVP